MLRSLTILSLSLLACAAGQAQSSEEIHLRANVKAIVMLSHFSGKVIPVDFDPRFALTLRIESARPSVNRFHESAVVTFAIHSPSELFVKPPRNGKTYNFSLSRTTEDGKVRFCCLQVE
jgi:hypothetical protein